MMRAYYMGNHDASAQPAIANSAIPPARAHSAAGDKMPAHLQEKGGIGMQTAMQVCMAGISMMTAPSFVNIRARPKNHRPAAKKPKTWPQPAKPPASNG